MTEHLAAEGWPGAPQFRASAAINIDTEQAFLGACLINSDVLDVVDGLISPEDFYEPIHARLFETFLRARAEGRRIDATLARAALGPDANQPLVGDMTVGG